MPEAHQPTLPGVLSPEEWAEAVRTQRIDQILPKHEGRSWGAIEVRPRNVRFATQNKGEKVFLLLRRHVITNIGWIANAAFLSLVPVIILIVLGTLGQNVTELVGFGGVTAILLVYYSFIFTNIVRHFVEWYYNLFLVTNERVINFDFKPFVSRGVNETRLENIENVREASIGFIPSLFNYGDVSVYSAADKSVITFYHIPKPTYVRDKIQDLADIIQDSKNEPK